MTSDSLAVPDYRPRVVDEQMRRMIRTAPAVVVEGPRACGKTWTGRQFARSMVRFDQLDATRLQLNVNPASFLVGEAPRLLDEWHLADGLWNAMRHACDDRGVNGQFILTGSVKPTFAATDHSGAGRVARLRMRPMSLWESGDSTGAVSLAGLLSGELCAADAAEADLDRIAALICRGGFPRFVTMSAADAQARLRDYLNDLSRIDLATGDSAAHDPQKMFALFASLARNEATSASLTTLVDDTASFGGPSNRDTVGRYLSRLNEAFVIEPLLAWSTHLRSKATLRSKPKRYFVDPSLATAALRASPVGLLADLEMLGLLFESLVIRDLRVYADGLAADVMYYRDSLGLEADAIITRGPGDWAAVEVKLGGTAAIADAVESLRRVRAKVDTRRAGEPKRLIVITAVGSAYETDDAIAVVPITHLRP